MRKSTITSLLILCGSTAALAQVTPVSPQTTNTTVSNDATLEPMPAPGNEMTPPPADNAVMTNEANPKPM